MPPDFLYSSTAFCLNSAVYLGDGAHIRLLSSVARIMRNGNRLVNGNGADSDLFLPGSKVFACQAASRFSQNSGAAPDASEFDRDWAASVQQLPHELVLGGNAHLRVNVMNVRIDGALGNVERLANVGAATPLRQQDQHFELP